MHQYFSSVQFRVCFYEYSYEYSYRVCFICMKVGMSTALACSIARCYLRVIMLRGIRTDLLLLYNNSTRAKQHEHKQLMLPNYLCYDCWRFGSLGQFFFIRPDFCSSSYFCGKTRQSICNFYLQYFSYYNAKQLFYFFQTVVGSLL